MYSIRLVTPLGSLDYKHKEAFKRFKDRIRQTKICPSCGTDMVTHDFTTFHNHMDDLMVAIKFFCKNCNWSKNMELQYTRVISDPSI